jgi:UMF1 family MFS transporter
LLISAESAQTSVPTRRPVVGWILYDLTNFIFAINIAGLYFPLWVVDDAGGRDAHVGIANGVSMAIIFCAAPIVGIIADQTGRRILLLTMLTLSSAGLVAILGRGGLNLSLVVYGLANAVFGCALVLYDALLPVVSTATNRGRVSGIGIGAGYAGALLGIGIGGITLALNPEGKPIVFTVTAVVMVACAIPCFLWVREPPRDRSTSVTLRIRSTFHLFRSSLSHARSIAGMPRFLVARIFYTDAANTMFAFVGIYATKEVGFSDAETQIVLASGILAGPVGALLAGRATDRIGPKTTLQRLLVLWVVVLTLCAVIPLFSLPRELFWFVAPLGGIAFGGTGTADRALLFQLAPSSRAGEFSGLFSMVGRFSAIIGPLIWAAQVDGLHLDRPWAIVSLALMAVFSLLIFRRIGDHQPVPEDESSY